MAQIYEVTIVVDGGRTAEFESYMADTHINEVLATGCFAAAFFARDGSTYTVGYHVNTPEDLDRYLNKHAGSLRQDVIDRFGESVSASRRTLDIVKLFPGS
ncbi:MAG: DUF4286 family protein [Acidobacteria bacterium]|nr:DUF4286 family protein [Acidobacteriota bacterium]